ncbi:hypothetical protein MNBD_DELTA03-687 [hydrothermal vent metagenome]|uniref:Uncharacterized protein n=1 Tax=hydrothermal vent metagenome TaxID=652676 RepID=A0A3B0VR04_9ZZZZ
MPVCKNVTVHLHPIFVRFVPLTYNGYASEAETDEVSADSELGYI